MPRAQIVKAVTALANFVERERSARKKLSLIQESEAVSLIVTLFKTPEKGRNKGIPIRLPHSLHSEDQTRVCIFVKDDALVPVKVCMSGGVPARLCVARVSRGRVRVREAAARLQVGECVCEKRRLGCK